MARTYTPRMYRICAMVAERPRSFVEIEAALEGIERLGLANCILRMADTGILRRVKRLADPGGDRKGRFVYARGDTPMPEQRLRPLTRAPRPLPVNGERGAPRVSMEAYGLLCKAYGIAPSAFAPTPSSIRTVRGSDTMRAGPDIARHALPVARFTLQVSEFPVVG